MTHDVATCVIRITPEQKKKLDELRIERYPNCSYSWKRKYTWAIDKLLTFQDPKTLTLKDLNQLIKAKSRK